METLPRRFWLFKEVVLLYLLTPATVAAQIVPDQTLLENSIVKPNCTTCEITGEPAQLTKISSIALNNFLSPQVAQHISITLQILKILSLVSLVSLYLILMAQFVLTI